MGKQFWVYILTNDRRTVLYVGMTSDLLGRITDHREQGVDSFTKQYNVTRLVWFEELPGAWEAIEREKQLKSKPRLRKRALIEETNPEWLDLYPQLMPEATSGEA